MAIFPYLVLTSCCQNENGEYDVLEFNLLDAEGNTTIWWSGACPECTNPDDRGVFNYVGPNINGLIYGQCYEVAVPNLIPPVIEPINPAPSDIEITPTGWINCEQTGVNGLKNAPLCVCPDVCYIIEPCDQSVPPFQISLSDAETVLLNIGQVYTFNDPSNTLIDNGCYKVLEEVPCLSPLYIDVTVVKDYDSTDCNICIPCYELTDCSDPNNTIYISWEPNIKPLDGSSNFKNSLLLPEKNDNPVSPVNTAIWHFADNTVANLNDATIGNDCTDFYSIYRAAKDSAIVGLNSENPQLTVDLFSVEWSELCTKVIKWLIDDTPNFRIWLWLVQNDDNTLSFYIVQEDNFATNHYTITLWNCCNVNFINEWNESDNLWPTLAEYATDSDIILDSYWDANTGCMARTNCDLTYIFSFNDTCWTAKRQYGPCDGALTLGPTDIVDYYEDCCFCSVSCYRLIDCEGLYPTISTDNSTFQAYVGKVIFWQDVLGENHCATVEAYECKNETYPIEPIIVLDCYDTCLLCNPPIPVPIFQISNRSATPGYNTPGCSPEYTEKVNSKFSEVVFQEMIAKRYGLDSCCDIDREKYEIKKALLDLAAIKEPYLCKPICVDYNYSLELNIGDSAITTYIDCDGQEQTLVKTAVSIYTDYALTVCALTTMVPVIVVTRANTSIEQYKLTTSYNTCCPVEIDCIGYTICMTNFIDGEQRVRYFDCDGIEQQIIQAKKTGLMFYYFCGIQGQTLVRDFAPLPSDTFEVNLVACTELAPEPTGSCAIP